jgi:uncharacterized protein (TIRG00374 family)
MKNKLLSAAKIIVFFGVGFILLYLVYKNQDAAYQAECALKGVTAENCSLLAKIMEDVSHAHLFWVIVPMMIFMTTNILRALRWKMMFQALGYSPRFYNLFGTIMINYLANLGVPRSGEVIRAGLLSKYEDIPMEKVLGTIFTDRIFDVLMLIIVLGLALIWGGQDFIQYLDTHISLSEKIKLITTNPLLSWGIVIIGFITFLFLWDRRSRLKSSRLGEKIYGILSGFMDGVRSVKKVSSVSLFLFYTGAIWVLYYLMLYVAFFSFDPTAHLGPREGLIVFVFGSLGILIPTPGGMGSYHFLVGEALGMYGISGTDAFTFANIVFFSIQIFVNILFGSLSMIYLAFKNKEKI